MQYVVIFLLFLLAMPASAQEARPLSLEEAIALAAGTSEEVEIARAGVDRAEANVDRTDSQRKPQVNASASYQRTLASQFEGIGGEQLEIPPDCQGPFAPDPSLPLEQRVSLLERRIACPAGGGFGGIDFSNLGFGSPNTWNFGFAFNWPFYTGGRVEAQLRAAESLRDVAETNVGATEAQARVDVTAAYFDAQLAAELVDIAQQSIAQAEETLRITSLRAREGAQAEFDVLQARVARDNQRPQLIRSSEMRELAFDRLRALTDLPPDQPLRLTTPVTSNLGREVDTDVAVTNRVPVQQARERVEAAESQLDAARAQRMPNVAAQSQYGQVAFSENFFPDLGAFRANWTVGIGLQIPLYAGGRITADINAARADVAEAEAQLEMITELARLDAQNALAELRAARATYAATEGTVEAAARGVEIANIRYREGVGIPLEVQNARLLLEQARVNRAQAARDLQVALARVELLPLLPLGGSGAQTAGGSLGASAAQAGMRAQQPAQLAPQGFSIIGMPQGGPPR